MNHPTETAVERGVRWSGPLPLHHFDAHTHAHMFHPDHPAWIDPFIGVDVFNMPQSFFLPHPHGGMSAITYLLPESPGLIYAHICSCPRIDKVSRKWSSHGECC